jgi:hypothetical protein
MTVFYSDHFSANMGVTGHWTTKLDPNKIVDIGGKHPRLRRNAARLLVPSTADLADNDEIHLFDMHSSDRLIELFVSCDAGWHTTATFNYGLYSKKTGLARDEDLFAAAFDQVNEIARGDIFDQSTTLADWDRGKALWELLEIGLSESVVADPQETYTIVATASANLTAMAAETEMLLEAWYIAGD